MSLVSERPRSGPPHYNGGQYKHTRHLPKIRLDSAMRDFQAMFPGLTPMVIEAVLRANGGAVDPTVEKLISMCCEQQQQQQQQKEKELLNESDLLPGYYEACCKEQPPPSYHATQNYVDASTQTEHSSKSCSTSSSSSGSCSREESESDRTQLDNVEHLCVATLCSGSNSSSNSLSSDTSSTSAKDDDEKVALYLQNKELLQQLRQKERIIKYLERNSTREQNNGIKPNRYSDPVMSLVPCVEGGTGTVHSVNRSTRNRRAQTLSIQRQQNSSPPPNATVDTKETLDIPDHSMLPALTRNQPCRKSAKKRLQNWSKKLLRRNVGNDALQVSPASSQAQLLTQDGDSIDSTSSSHC